MSPDGEELLDAFFELSDSGIRARNFHRDIPLILWLRRPNILLCFQMKSVPERSPCG